MFSAEDLARAMQIQTETLLNNMLINHACLTPRNCSRVEFNGHTGCEEFVTYDENGDIISRSTIYPGESLNGWTI